MALSCIPRYIPGDRLAQAFLKRGVCPEVKDTLRLARIQTSPGLTVGLAHVPNRPPISDPKNSSPASPIGSLVPLDHLHQGLFQLSRRFPVAYQCFEPGSIGCGPGTALSQSGHRRGNGPSQNGRSLMENSTSW